MKKILSMNLIILLLLTGCATKKDVDIVQSEVKINQEENEEIADKVKLKNESEEKESKVEEIKEASVGEVKETKDEIVKDKEIESERTTT